MVWTQLDAPAVLRAHLTRATGGRVEVAAQLPRGWTPRARPVVTVVGDGTSHSHSGYTRETVRVSVHARDIIAARGLLTALDSYLLSPISRLRLRLTPSAGLIVIHDSHVGGGVASASYVITHSRRKDA